MKQASLDCLIWNLFHFHHQRLREPLQADRVQLGWLACRIKRDDDAAADTIHNQQKRGWMMMMMHREKKGRFC